MPSLYNVPTGRTRNARSIMWQPLGEEGTAGASVGPHSNKSSPVRAAASIERGPSETSGCAQHAPPLSGLRPPSGISAGQQEMGKSLQGSGISCLWFLVSGTPTDPVTSAWFPGVCAVNGLLYVVGGDDGSCNLASVEYYNPVTDKWTLLPANMSTGRSYAGQWHPLPGTTTPRAGTAWGMSWLSRE